MPRHLSLLPETPNRPKRRRCLINSSGNVANVDKDDPVQVDEDDYGIVASWTSSTWEVDNMDKQCRIAFLHFIDSKNGGWGPIPEELFELSGLRSLEISSSCISSIPSSIQLLQNLKELEIEFNQLERLPEEIGDLVHLERLKLGGNPLSSLPDSIGSLKNLQYLDLHSTKIRGFPNSFWDLTALEALDANGEHNVLSIPPSIERLQNLTTLSLGIVKALPEEIGNLTKLKQLKLVGHVPKLRNEHGKSAKSQTIHLPSSMKNLQKLRDLDIRIRCHESNRNAILDAHLLDFVQMLPELRGLRCVPPPEPPEVLLDIVKACPSLHSLCFERVDWNSKMPPDMIFALACNKFHCDCSPFRETTKVSLCLKLWPKMISKAPFAFRANSRIVGWENESRVPRITISPHDAVYKLLLDGRGSFLQVLMGRKRGTRSNSTEWKG